MTDWRDLWRQWRIEHPDYRPVRWTCNHGPGESTDNRGPLQRQHKFLTKRQRETLHVNRIVVYPRSVW